MITQKHLVIGLIVLSLLSPALCDEEDRCKGCGYGGTAIVDGQLIIKYDSQWRSVCMVLNFI